MNCDQVREILFQSADSDLPDQLRRDLDAHVAECRSCADEADALRKEWDALRSLPQVKAPADFLDRVHERLGRRVGVEKAGKWASTFFGGKGLVEAAGLAVSALLVVVIYHAVTREMPHPTAPAVPPSVESPAKVESVHREGASGRGLRDVPEPPVSAPAPAETALQEAKPALMTLTLTIPSDATRKKEGERAASRAPSVGGMKALREIPSAPRAIERDRGLRQRAGPEVSRAEVEERDGGEMRAARDEEPQGREVAADAAADKKRQIREEIAGRDADNGETSVTEYPEAIGSALERIRQFIGEAQGRVVAIEASESVGRGKAWVVAEMPVEAFYGFLSRLKQLGNIQEAKNGGIEQQPGPTVKFNLQISAAGD
jgi:hypothetical protein